MSKKNNNLTINFLLSLFSLQELTSSSCSSWQAEAVNFMVWREFKREEKAGRVCFQALVSLPLLPTVTVCMYVCLSVCIFYFLRMYVLLVFLWVCVWVWMWVCMCVVGRGCMWLNLHWFLRDPRHVHVCSIAVKNIKKRRRKRRRKRRNKRENRKTNRLRQRWWW